MSGTTEAFAHVKIDALLQDAGWNLADGSSVLFVFLSDGEGVQFLDRESDARRGGSGPPAARSGRV